MSEPIVIMVTSMEKDLRDLAFSLLSAGAVEHVEGVQSQGFFMRDNKPRMGSTMRSLFVFSERDRINTVMGTIRAEAEEKKITVRAVAIPVIETI